MSSDGQHTATLSEPHLRIPQNQKTKTSKPKTSVGSGFVLHLDFNFECHIILEQGLLLQGFLHQGTCGGLKKFYGRHLEALHKLG